MPRGDGLSIAFFALYLSVPWLVGMPTARAEGVITTLGVGASPLAVAVDPIRNRYYVCSSGTVAVIDGATQARSFITLPAGTVGAAGIAVDPERNQIYVASTNGTLNGTISFIDGASKTVIYSILLLGLPRSVVVDPQSGQVFVAMNDSSVRQFSPDTFQSQSGLISFSPHLDFSRMAMERKTDNRLIYTCGTESSGAAHADVFLPYFGNAAVLVPPADVALDSGETPIDMVLNDETGIAYVSVQNGSAAAVYAVQGGVAGPPYVPTAVRLGKINFTAIGTPIAMAVNKPLNAVYVWYRNVATSQSGVAVIRGLAVNPSVPNITAQLPESVAWNPLTNLAYLTDSPSTLGVGIPENSYLTVFDGSSNTVANSLFVGYRSKTLSLNPLAERACVVNNQYGDITLVDLARLTKTASDANTGTAPAAIAVNPVTSKFYAVNETAPYRITIGNSRTGGVLASLPIAEKPYAVAVDQVNNLAYVGTATSTRVIDGSNTLVATIAAPATTHQGLAVNPVTRRIYALDNAAGLLRIINGVNNAVIAILLVGNDPVAVDFNPATNQVYVSASGSNAVTVIDGASATVLSSISTQNNPRSLAVDPGLNRIFVANQGSGSVTVIDGDTFGTSHIPVGTTPGPLVVNPATHRIYCVTGDNVAVMDGAKLALLGTIAVSTGPAALTVDPMANRVYVAGASNNIDVVDGLSNTKSATISSSTFTAGTPTSICCDTLANTVCALDRTANKGKVLDVQPEQTTAMTVTPSLNGALAGNVTFSAYPGFTFTVANTGVLTPRNVYYQVDSKLGEWQRATLISGSTWGATCGTRLTPGMHQLFAFVTDGDVFSAGYGKSSQATPSLSQVATVAFMVQHNNVPTLNPIATQNVTEDTSFVVNLTGITAGNPNENNQTVAVSAVSGNPALLPDPLVTYTSPNATGSLAFVPAASQYGTAVVTVVVRDNGGTGNGGSDTLKLSFTVNVLPVNHAPTLSQPADVTISEDSGLTRVPLTGISYGQGDPAQPPLSFIYASDNPALVPPQTAPQLVTGDSAYLEFTPVPNINGTANLTISLQDGGGTGNGGIDTVTRSFRVTVTPVNHAPVAGVMATQTTNEDTPCEIVLAATDVDHDALTFMVVTPPAHGALSGTAPNLTYTPTQDFNGTDSFTYKAYDGQLDSNVSTVPISILPLPDPSITALSATAAVIHGGGFTITVDGTDFASDAEVLFGGVAVPTQVFSSTQVTANVSTDELAQAGAIPIAVRNPNPGGGMSNALDFYVYSGTTPGVWIVTNTEDSGQGSLRLAMSSVRFGEQILFDPTVFDMSSANAATMINVKSPLPPLSAGNVTIDAQDRRVTVNGSGAGTADGLLITSDGNHIMGLTIVGFTLAGMHIQDAQNNVIGGSRVVGSGPNGQGLRLSGNGTYGLRISGPRSSNNTVHGCWIGLDASGLLPLANLAGVILDAGANHNTVGSVISGEHNVISGNIYEGLTVAGDGTDENVIAGNLVGVSAVPESLGRGAGSRADDDLALPGRSAVGNGSAGVFLSHGTKGTHVGGTDTGQENVIAYNGGRGMEVRAAGSRHNSAQGNKISHNRRGGIALYDHSNDNISPPNFDSISFMPGRSGLSLSGTVSGDGTVEIFSDSGRQGGRMLGRAVSTGGHWQLETDVPEGENITATYTDSNGNTSEFAFYGPAIGKDSDGDGVPDALESLAGTDPNNASDTPTQGGSLTVATANVALSFVSTKPSADALQVSLRATLPTAFSAPHATVGLLFGSMTAQTTLDAKGKGPRGGLTVKITPGKTGPAVVQFGLSKANLKAAVATCGLSDKNTPKSGEVHTVIIGMALATTGGLHYVYSGEVDLLYVATQGKAGKAKKAP